MAVPAPMPRLERVQNKCSAAYKLMLFACPFSALSACLLPPPYLSIMLICLPVILSVCRPIPLCLSLSLSLTGYRKSLLEDLRSLVHRAPRVAEHVEHQARADPKGRSSERHPHHGSHVVLELVALARLVRVVS